MDESPRRMRINSTFRGLFIAALISIYGVLTQYPQPSFKAMFLIGAALQFAVILLRRFAPASVVPRVQDLAELIADAGTVLAFAIGVMGHIASHPAEV